LPNGGLARECGPLASGERPSSSGCFLEKPFGPERRLDSRTGRYALEIGLQVRERRQVNFQEGGPARDGEQVRIRCREAVAQQKGLLREMPIQSGKALVELLDRCRTGLLPGGRVPERAKALVDLRADKGQPLHKPVSGERPLCRRQTGPRGLVHQVLKDGSGLCEDLAVLELQGRHIG
jgi:hypothetical protein